MAKGKLSHYWQLLLLSQCFQKSSAAVAGVNMWGKGLTLSSPKVILRFLHTSQIQHYLSFIHQNYPSHKCIT